MNKKTHLFFIIFYFSIFIPVSCTKEPTATPIEPDIPKNVQLHHIPFASQSELDLWQGNSDIVYYRTARMLAILELEYNTHEISELPVVLYDFDNTPRYYEFIHLNNGKPDGTVCLYARKEQPAVVAFMLPYLRDYPAISVKSLGLQTFVENYPNLLYYGLSTRSGGVASPFINTKGEMVNETPPVQHLIDPISQIDHIGADYFEALGIEDLPAQKEAIIEALKQEKEAAAAYWELVALIEKELISLEQMDWMQTKATVTYIDEFVLPQYDTEAMQKTRWNGGCGPSALANMYRGLYDSYKGMYLPLWGDSDFLQDSARGRMIINDRAVYFYKDFDNDSEDDKMANIVNRSWVELQSACTDNGLYADICDYGLYYFAYRIPFVPTWGAALPINLVHSLERITHHEYSLTILPAFSPHHHIRTKKLPLILLNSKFNHYLCAYGSREQHWKWETVFKLFGKEIKIGTPEVVTHRWFKVNDSGTDMDSHNMLPFWVDDCITTFIFRFAVYKCKE